MPGGAIFSTAITPWRFRRRDQSADADGHWQHSAAMAEDGLGKRVWSQFRRWSRNGTWACALTVLHVAAREAEGRAEAMPSMLVIDTHLARGASNGGATFHDRGGPFGRTKGAKRVVAVGVTGLPVAGVVVPASMHENETTRVVLDHLAEQGVTDRLELVLVDRGVSAGAAGKLGRRHGWRYAGSAGMTSSRSFVPSGTPGAWRWHTAASVAAAGSPNPSRTPPPQRPAGYRSPASLQRSGTSASAARARRWPGWSRSRSWRHLTGGMSGRWRPPAGSATGARLR